MSANPKVRTDVWLYVANLSLLATHQADAAYWHEWDVFGVPGGLPFFLLFTVTAVALLGTGLVRVAEGAPALGLLLAVLLTSIAQLLRLPPRK